MIFRTVSSMTLPRVRRQHILKDWRPQKSFPSKIVPVDIAPECSLRSLTLKE